MAGQLQCIFTAQTLDVGVDVNDDLSRKGMFIYSFLLHIGTSLWKMQVSFTGVYTILVSFMFCHSLHNLDEIVQLALCFSIHLTAACAYLQHVFKTKGLKMGTSAQKCAFAPQFSPDNLIKVKNCIIITSDDSSILESSF